MELAPMLRITQTNDLDSRKTFKLDGKLLGPWVAEVKQVCTEGHGQPERIHLDLSGLTYADQAGAMLLKDLVRRGITVSSCSGFIAQLLRLEIS
jgi:ABC-type transporter Mla MlaB component